VEGYPDVIDPSLISASSNVLYWVEGASIMASIGVCGGTLVTLGVGNMDPAFDTIEQLSAQNGWIYWTTDGPPGGLWRMPVSGGTPRNLSSLGANDFTQNGGAAFWVDALGEVVSVPLQGGKTVTLASAGSYPVNRDVLAIGFAANETEVYWSNSSLLVVPVRGGTPQVLAERALGDVAIDNVFIYWVNSVEGVGTVMKMPLGGGAEEKLAGDQRRLAASACNLAVDSNSVYWAAGRQIMSVPKTGGTPVEVATSEGDITCIALDDTSVYWTVAQVPSQCGGAIMKVTPK
jgi:hypothetical protein